MSARGFTLVEVLVSLAVAGVLAAMLLPALSHAREAGRAVRCGSNARQLAVALDLYADDHEDRYAPAAAAMLANLSRWHGVRGSASGAFESEGALSPYFDGGSEGLGRAVRACPTFVPSLEILREAGAGFERGCGGYGYNGAYAGVDRGPERPGAGGALVSEVRTDEAGSSRARFLSPSGTVGFADAALASRSPAGDVVEYSFVEPRRHPHLGPGARPDPSLHFRHGGGRATVAWLDGHITAERMTFSWSSGMYVPEARGAGIGWFGETDDNDLFDYR